MNSGWFVLGGALFGFIGALIATWLNNRENAKRQEKQLTHDAEQRRLDREKSLQREVLLQAAEGIAQWQSYLSNFAVTHLTPQEHNEILKGAGQKIGKAYIIGTPDTLKALVKLDLYFCENALILSEKRFEYSRNAANVSELRTQLQYANDRIMQTTINTGEYAQWQLNINAIDSSITQAIREDDALLVELIKETSRAANEFANISIDAIIAARRELGMSLSGDDEVEYRQKIKELTGTVHKNTSEWADRMRKKFGIDARQSS